MSYIRYTRSKDGLEVWESVDTDPAAKDSDYQFLLSLEENKKSTLIGKASAIISVASLVLAIVVFTFDNLKILFPLLNAQSNYFLIIIYLILFFVTLLNCSSAILENNKTKYQTHSDIAPVDIVWKNLYFDTKSENDNIQKKIRISYTALLITTILFLLEQIIIVSILYLRRL